MQIPHSIVMHKLLARERDDRVVTTINCIKNDTKDINMEFD